ncbi:DUF2911 domain-containing protein [Flavobacteriaceae bacterium]|jgi:hypothetical protein|nr:DUF2911 domain-containing protein [Flavobacteriaceae bacterium]|tara:strand:- start:64 stop:594 length:531 start_codon:yes stop_codon:yes gene_type:complete
MKKIILLVAVFALTIGFSNQAIAQNFKGLDKSPMDIASFPSNYRVSEKVIKIIYSRPQLKGRSLEKLAPLGKKWRTGANEATEVTFYKDVVFGGTAVKAGTYTMYAIPGKTTWTVVLSSQLNVWGVYFHKDENDVAKVTIPVKQTEENLDVFSIAIDEDMTINLGWGTTLISIPVQ